MTALRRPYVCPKDNVPVESKDMVKGYDTRRPVCDPDGQGLDRSRSRKQGPGGPRLRGIGGYQPDPARAEYYLGPEEISLKPFELFRQAHADGEGRDRAGGLWKKEQLVSISPLNAGSSSPR